MCAGDYGRAAVGLHASGPFGHPSDPGKPTLGIKMFVTVSDQDEEMGCTSFVPGSHRIAEEPRSIWRNGVVSEEEGGGAFDAQARLPHVRFAGRAGDAMIMDLRTWHTAMPNTTDRDRETLIISFNNYIVKGMEGSTRRLFAEGRLPAAETDPALRHMLGIERTDGGADYFNCDWLRENPRPDLV